MSLYAADGSWNVTVVDGTTFTGLYAPDGSYNVVEVDGTSLEGLYAPCGAYNVFVSDGSTLGFYHPSGAINVSVSPYQAGVIRVTAVSGDLGSLAPNPPTITLTSGASDLTPEFTFVASVNMAEDDVIRFYDQTLGLLASHTVTAGEAGGSPIYLDIPELTAGDYDFYATHERAGSESSASNVQSITLTSSSTGWNTNFWWR